MHPIDVEIFKSKDQKLWTDKKTDVAIPRIFNKVLTYCIDLVSDTHFRSEM